MRLCIITLVFSLTCCAYFVSWEESNQSAVGHPIVEIARVWGPPDQKWVRKDGKTIYEYELKKLDPSCVHYWVVNKRGIIESFYYEGNCQPIS